MLFSNKILRIHNDVKKEIQIKINEIQLEVVVEYKYLGIILDEHLTFVRHVNYLVAIISHRT